MTPRCSIGLIILVLRKRSGCRCVQMDRGVHRWVEVCTGGQRCAQVDKGMCIGRWRCAQVEHLSHLQHFIS